VKKLPKPSIPVWTANQLARREPGEVRALLRSAEDLRKAQQRALGGKGAADLAKRVEDQRAAVRALARLGRDILASEGRSVSDAIVERIAKTLEAAALDEGSRFQLRAGRLTDELEPPGFDALAGMAIKPSKPGRASRTGKGDRVAEARRALKEARQEARAQDRAAREAETAADKARRAAEDARARADEAEQAVAEAERALRDAQR
jgi:hypothetical protein